MIEESILIYSKETVGTTNTLKEVLKINYDTGLNLQDPHKLPTINPIHTYFDSLNISNLELNLVTSNSELLLKYSLLGNKDANLILKNDIIKYDNYFMYKNNKSNILTLDELQINQENVRLKIYEYGLDFIYYKYNNLIDLFNISKLKTNYNNFLFSQFDYQKLLSTKIRLNYTHQELINTKIREIIDNNSVIDYSLMPKSNMYIFLILYRIKCNFDKIDVNTIKQLENINNNDVNIKKIVDNANEITNIKDAQKKINDTILRLSKEQQCSLYSLIGQCISLYNVQESYNVISTSKNPIELMQKKYEDNLADINNSIDQLKNSNEELNETIQDMNQLKLENNEQISTLTAIIEQTNDLTEIIDIDQSEYSMLDAESAIINVIENDTIKNNMFNFIKILDDLNSVPQWRALLSRTIYSYFSSIKTKVKNGEIICMIPSYDHFNIILMGTPGIGKSYTSINIGKALKYSGLLTNGNLRAVKKPDIIASYTGQTTPKVYKELSEGLGNIVFLDEAYSIAGKKDKTKGTFNEYGQEALDAITDFTSEHIGLFAIVAAGYEYEMRNQFISVNIGLPRRFPEKSNLVLNRYDLKTLWIIYWSNLKKKLSNASIVREKHKMYFSLLNLMFNYQINTKHPTIQLDANEIDFNKYKEISYDLVIENDNIPLTKLNLESSKPDPSESTDESVTIKDIDNKFVSEIFTRLDPITQMFVKNFIMYRFSNSKIYNGDLFRSQSDNMVKLSDNVLENLLLGNLDENSEENISKIYFEQYIVNNPNKSIYNLKCKILKGKMSESQSDTNLSPELKSFVQERNLYEPGSIKFKLIIRLEDINPKINSLQDKLDAILTNKLNIDGFVTQFEKFNALSPLEKENYVYTFILITTYIEAYYSLQNNTGEFNVNSWWFYENADFERVMKDINLEKLLSSIPTESPNMSIKSELEDAQANAEEAEKALEEDNGDDGAAEVGPKLDAEGKNVDTFITDNYDDLNEKLGGVDPNADSALVKASHKQIINKILKIYKENKSQDHILSEIKKENIIQSIQSDGDDGKKKNYIKFITENFDFKGGYNKKNRTKKLGVSRKHKTKRMNKQYL